MPEQVSRIRALGKVSGKDHAGRSACIVGGGEAGSIGAHDYVIRMLGHGNEYADYIVAPSHRYSHYRLQKERPDCPIWVYGLRPDGSRCDAWRISPWPNAVFVDHLIEPYLYDGACPLRGCMAGILAMLLLDIDRLYFYGCDMLMRGELVNERATLMTIAHEKGIMLVDCSSIGGCNYEGDLCRQNYEP